MKIATCPPVHHPNELFVGDLSFFCTEADLFQLLSSFGRVESLRIVFNEQKSRSLMFGFIIMSAFEEAEAAVHYLNNQLFMGRKMK